MKFLGLFIVFGALYITWSLFNDNSAVVSKNLHMQIQKSLVEKITQEIITSNPKAYDIKIPEFWTETIGEKNIAAHFKLEFKEKDLKGEIKVVKNGQILLSKVKEVKGVEQWEAKSLLLKGQKITFKEGLTFFKKKTK